MRSSSPARPMRVEPSPGLAGLAELAQQVEPVAIREAEIKDRQLRCVAGNEAPALGRGPRLQRFIGVGGQVVGEETTRRGVVLYDQNRRQITLHIGMSPGRDTLLPLAAATSLSDLPARKESRI